MGRRIQGEHDILIKLNCRTNPTLNMDADENGAFDGLTEDGAHGRGSDPYLMLFLIDFVAGIRV